MTVRLYDGPREALLPFFRLADDSETALRAYMHDGWVWVAGAPGIVGYVQLTADGGVTTREFKSMAVSEAWRGGGVGRALVQAALAQCRADGVRRVTVATGAADVGNLRFYQRLGFRIQRVERDAFTPANGYPQSIVVDGVRLLDRVWLDLEP